MASQYTEADVVDERVIRLEERLLRQTEKYMKQRCDLVSFVLVELLPRIPVVCREPLEGQLWRLLK